MKSIVGIGAFFLLLLIVVTAVLILVPFVFIWAINTLFGINTPYSLTTWLAAFIVILLLGWHKIIPVYTNGMSWRPPRRRRN